MQMQSAMAPQVAGAMRTTVTTAMATPNCDEKRGHQQQKQGQIDDVVQDEPEMSDEQ